MTILGLHTAHELSDLLDAKNSNINSLSAALAGVTSSVDLSDPTWAKWMSDYQAFMASWATANSYASTLVAADKASLTGWDYTTEEAAYAQILSVLPPFDDLVSRWASLPSNPDPTEANAAPTPQPTAPDSDLNTFNASAPVANAVDQVVADAESAAKAVSSALSSPKLLIVAGAVGLLAVLLVVRR